MVATLCGCGEPRTPEGAAVALPAQIHGLQLVESRSGEEAASMIGRLHGKGVAPTESHIRLYGPGAMRAVLYVSRFASESEAHTQLDAMAARIAGGASGYGHYRQFDVGGANVYSAFSEGQVHYFFAEDTDLTWLAAPPALARAALAELLGVVVDSVPALIPG